MRRPSSRLTPNTVTVVRVNFGRDAAKGRLQTATPDPTVWRAFRGLLAFATWMAEERGVDGLVVGRRKGSAA